MVVVLELIDVHGVGDAIVLDHDKILVGLGELELVEAESLFVDDLDELVELGIFLKVGSFM